MRWGVEKRLEFIEFQLLWQGWINRTDLMEQFGVSVPQASKDLALYRERAPTNIKYDLNQKRYVATRCFAPKFIKADAAHYLGQLRFVAEGAHDIESTWITNPPAFEAAPIPLRHVEAPVLRQVLAAVRDNRAIEVFYQSLSPGRPNAMWRWISPHAFAFDGNRWHVRAYCHLDGIFKDFMLTRILEVRGSAEAQAAQQADERWLTFVTVSLVPSPALSPAQAAVIERDFGMADGHLDIPVRVALAFYLLRRLNLHDYGEGAQSIRDRPLTLANPDEVRSAIRGI